MGRGHVLSRSRRTFKTSYAADMALYPLPLSRWTLIAVVGAVLRWSCRWSSAPYYLSMLNLVLVAVVGALGLNILLGYTGQISIGHGAFMSVGAYTAAKLRPAWAAVLDHDSGGRRYDGACRRHRRHTVAAHQGPVSGHRHAGRAVHHRVDDQPRHVDLGRHVRPRSRSRARRVFGIAIQTQLRSSTCSCWASRSLPSSQQ